MGNGFYSIRKPNARIVLKIDPTTGKLDIVAFAIRSNYKTMETLATVVNSQCDTKIKINSKSLESRQFSSTESNSFRS